VSGNLCFKCQGGRVFVFNSTNKSRDMKNPTKHCKTFRIDNMSTFVPFYFFRFCWFTVFWIYNLFEKKCPERVWGEPLQMGIAHLFVFLDYLIYFVQSSCQSIMSELKVWFNIFSDLLVETFFKYKKKTERFYHGLKYSAVSEFDLYKKLEVVKTAFNKFFCFCPARGRGK
jgi:hypothetical protein